MKKTQDKSYKIAKSQLSNSGGFARAGKLAQAGIASSSVARLARQGVVVRIKRGLYRWHKANSSSSLVEAVQIVPSGIVCLLSALAVHQLGSRIPWEVHLAIPRSARRPVMPEYPPIRIVYYSDVQYQTGITTTKIDGVDIRVYDPEKTLCDCARYRNKIGMDVFREALTEYLRRPGRNIDKLLAYAKQQRVWSVLYPVVEALA
jgi:predicted transcriptional regulator of viral defense system